ncbi:UPF0692 protein C19orf54 homolog isoform X3 [Polyodon spathula]|nr:UPF0692 protein C19orf54 homolog isoform X3 [Polyodon spathula]XP_041092299.1 UPF0692 protein C19orf54 homolog isoform X3 [Polyodon spathula]
MTASANDGAGRCLIPPPPPPPPPASSALPGKKKLYQAIAEGKAPVEGDYEEARILLRNRMDSFSTDLQWLLYNKYVPSLIQDGPQCGLVALWMAGQLLAPRDGIALEQLVSVAVQRGYTAQGEMFSASNMGLLAEEVFRCRAQLLTGGMGGENRAAIIRHLATGLPLLIPLVSYDEDFNHQPCLKRGHRAHWAVVSGVLLGVDPGSLTGPLQADGTVPGLFYPPCPGQPPSGSREVCLLAKQGKSLRYQLWGFTEVQNSNAQLEELQPQRESDGTVYVLPEGGVRAGLCGQVLLLQPDTDSSTN